MSTTAERFFNENGEPVRQSENLGRSSRQSNDGNIPPPTTPSSLSRSGPRNSGSSSRSDPRIRAGLQKLPGYGQTLPSGSGEYSMIRIFEQTTKSYVNFTVTPEVSESKNVSYIEVSEIRQAGSIMVFIASPGRNFSVNAKLVSRTMEEAAENFTKLNLLKSWGQPDKKSVATGIAGGGAIDSTGPSVLYIYGYGKLLKGIQVVMKSIEVSYPTDVDYIPIARDSKTKMPIIMPVSMTFQEIRSAEELNKFDIEAYKLGELEYW